SDNTGYRAGKSPPRSYRFVRTIADSLYTAQSVSQSSPSLRTPHRAVPMHVWLLRYWSFKLISLGGMALAVFALPHLMSRQPVTLYENWPANAQQRARLITDYGFDRPLPAQGALWMPLLVTVQWGASRYSNRPVFYDIWQATSRTTLLLLWTLLACSLGTAVLWGMHHLAPWLSALLPRSQLLAILEA